VKANKTIMSRNEAKVMEGNQLLQLLFTYKQYRSRTEISQKAHIRIHNPSMPAMRASKAYASLRTRWDQHLLRSMYSYALSSSLLVSRRACKDDFQIRKTKLSLRSRIYLTDTTGYVRSLRSDTERPES
jgi:hypothetical protein